MHALHSKKTLNGVRSKTTGSFCNKNRPPCTSKRATSVAETLFLWDRYRHCYSCIWNEQNVHLVEILRHLTSDKETLVDYHWADASALNACSIPLFDPLRRIAPASTTDRRYLAAYYDGSKPRENVCEFVLILIRNGLTVYQLADNKHGRML